MSKVELPPIPPVWTFYTAELTPIERGVLADIAVHYHQHGDIPKDDTEFAQLSGITVEEWRKLAKPVLESWGRVKPILFRPRRKRGRRT